MNYKECAVETYKKFSKIDGNQHIAGDYALEFILKIIKDFKVKSVLEVGLGIGSIADAILTYSVSNNLKINYSGTEANEFCLNALSKNVIHYNLIKLYSNINSVTNACKFDLIIVDGSDDSLEKISKIANENAIVFIEGGRANQVDNLKNIFPKYKYAEIISVRKPPEYGPFKQRWTGGGGLIFVNPTLHQKAYVFKEKIKTYVKRRLRKIN
jgi:hypothetical protein